MAINFVLPDDSGGPKHSNSRRAKIVAVNLRVSCGRWDPETGLRRDKRIRSSVTRSSVPEEAVKRERNGEKCTRRGGDTTRVSSVYSVTMSRKETR